MIEQNFELPPFVQLCRFSLPLFLCLMRITVGKRFSLPHMNPLLYIINYIITALTQGFADVLFLEWLEWHAATGVGPVLIANGAAACWVATLVHLQHSEVRS